MIFAKTVDDCEVMFGDTIKAIDPERDGTRVMFESGKERFFDLVVGADGLHSTVRGWSSGRKRDLSRPRRRIRGLWLQASRRRRVRDL